MKDCAANGEIPSFGQLEDSFGLSGVVSLYFFSVFFFLATLALLVLSLAKLYQNVGRSEVRFPGQSQRVLKAKAELQVSSVCLILSVPSVLSLYQMLTVLVPQVRPAALQTKIMDYYQPGQPVPSQRGPGLRGGGYTQVGQIKPFQQNCRTVVNH